MSVEGPQGQTLTAYQPAPAGTLNEAFTRPAEDLHLTLSRRADALHAMTSSVKASLGRFQTRAKMDEVRRHLDNIESEARRLRAILP